MGGRRSLLAQSTHAAERSPGNVAQLVLTAALIVAATWLGPVRSFLGVGSAQMATGLAIAVGGILLCTATYHVAGHPSRAYRAAGIVETAMIQGGIMWLILASGRSASPLYVLYLAHAANQGREVDMPRAQWGVFGGLPAILAVTLAFARHDPGGAVFALMVGALGLQLMGSARRGQLQLEAALDERERLAAELGELRLRDERNRIARELHDGLGADLTTIAWRGESVGAQLDGAVRDEVAAIAERARTGLDELRSAQWCGRRGLETATPKRDLVVLRSAASGERTGLRWKGFYPIAARARRGRPPAKIDRQRQADISRVAKPLQKAAEGRPCANNRVGTGRGLQVPVA